MAEETGLSEHVRIVYDPMYLTPYSTAGCESPQRVQSIMAHLSDRFTILQPESCTEDDILMCHSEGLLIREKTVSDRYEAARRAAGGAILTARLAMEGYVGFGVIRPPGHHASPDHNWGFCFFNNMGIAIKKLLKEEKIKSAVILDIDLHFGDGTDNIFKGYRNVQVLNISGANPADYIAETREALDKIERSDMLGISAGFDQYELDWGGNLSTADYRTIGEIAAEFAADKTGGRLFGLLEGGYYIPDLGENLVALLTGMCGRRTAR